METLRALAASPQGLLVTCTGSSMEPTLRSGDAVRIRTRPRIRVGDVVLLVRGEDAAVLHRVIMVLPRTDAFVHCGDAGLRGAAGISRCGWVIGHAELPRRPPPAMSWLAAGRCLAIAARTRLSRLLMARGAAS